ncbi:hypothetical protein F4861DRAFT_534738 [Xylaria intraflava]|nr:hypothetical protein F4861DRAFT_534738 [Xylaria intraflava]
MTGLEDSSPGDQSTLPEMIQNAGFPKFMMLPAEVRVLIYREAILEAMKSVQTITIRRGRWGENDTVLVYTRQSQNNGKGIMYTCHEAREETKRFFLTLPTRFVTDPGANLINMNQGQNQNIRPIKSLSIGDKLYHYDATFSMDEASAIEMFNSLCTGRQTGAQFGWLRNLLVDKRTFLHLLSGYHDFARSRPGAPFTELPGLRRIVVGFAYRFQDVAVVEGSYDDVVTEVEVIRIPGRNGEAANCSIVPREIHSMIELMIISTACQTTNEVADLESAGIEVVWASINGEALIRRPDILKRQGIRQIAMSSSNT